MGSMVRTKTKRTCPIENFFWEFSILYILHSFSISIYEKPMKTFYKLKGFSSMEVSPLIPHNTTRKKKTI